MDPRPGRRLAAAAPVVVGLGLCLAPHLARLGSPSLYADDVARVAQLQTGPLGGMLFAPFNEHVAPLFQVVSWATWRLAGRSLAGAPRAFTVASLVPFVLTLGLLAGVLRRETRSPAAALAGVAVFSLSWLAVEAVYWYSASSFMWSLLLTLAAWRPAGKSAAARRAAGLIAAASAPAFSMIGLLAGPVAAVRAVADGGRRARLDALAPLAGSLLFLAVYGAVRDRVGAGGSAAGVLPGLLAATRAPAASLVPALFGVKTLPASGAFGVLMSLLTAAATLGLLARAGRVGGDRAAVLGGLALIAGGYALTFCARAGVPGRALLETQRYHLFPMLGLVFLLAPGLSRGFAWCDRRRPGSGLWAAAGLAALLLATHRAELHGRARFLRFPDQARTLAALDRLGALCAREGVTRPQALAALDPVEPAWCPEGYSALLMLGPCSPASRVPDALVKPTLLALLSESDRQSLCGAMDATPYLRPAAGAVAGAVALAVARPVGRFRVHDGAGGRPFAAGWPAYVEYDLGGPSPPDARALALTADGPTGWVEVWWKGTGGRWSETRSVRLRPRSGGSWVLPLDRLPHWRPAEARSLRLLFHDAGPLALGAPRLVR